VTQHHDHQTEIGGSVQHHHCVFCSALATRTAYALAGIAVSFRVTHVVDIVRGVHAMIPKSLFTGELRRQIAAVV
jgi:acetamidase/formamidase